MSLKPGIFIYAVQIWIMIQNLRWLISKVLWFSLVYFNLLLLVYGYFGSLVKMEVETFFVNNMLDHLEASFCFKNLQRMHSTMKTFQINKFFWCKDCSITSINWIFNKKIQDTKIQLAFEQTTNQRKYKKVISKNSDINKIVLAMFLGIPNFRYLE